jgi:flagellar hook-length control protein FliK
MNLPVSPLPLAMWPIAPTLIGLAPEGATPPMDFASALEAFPAPAPASAPADLTQPALSQPAIATIIAMIPPFATPATILSIQDSDPTAPESDAPGVSTSDLPPVELQVPFPAIHPTFVQLPVLPIQKPVAAKSSDVSLSLDGKMISAPLRRDEAVLQSLISSSFAEIKPVASMASPQPAPLVGLADRQLDLARDNLWLDQLAQDIVAASSSEDTLSFRLMPKHLGRLDVDVSMTEAGMAVRMTAATDEARTAIAAAQPRLIEELRTQGLRVTEAQVHTGDTRQQGQGHATGMAAPLIETALLFDEVPPTEAIRPTGRYA